MHVPARPTIPELDSVGLDAVLKGAREIYVSGCSAEVAELPDLLGPGTAGATVTGIFNPVLNTRSYAAEGSGRRCRTFFLNRILTRDLAAGRIDFCPWTYTQIVRFMQAPGRFDAAIVMVSPPDGSGLCSFGTQADFCPDFHRNVPRLIGIINPRMPRTAGPTIDIRDFAAAFEYDRPLLETPQNGTATDLVSDAIGRRLADLVPEGATLQMGIGRMPQAAAAALTGHRGLRIHSGLVDDSTLVLERAGALDRDVPIVAGVAIGSSAEFYEQVDRNPRFSFRPASYTHAPEVIASIPKFVAINTAIQVDLFGQVNSEGADGRILASAGGLPDFLRGARRSEGGLSVIVLRAERGRNSEGGIVPRICEPRLVTGARYDIDMVVTEHGVADLRELSTDQRTERLIAVADPAERDRLDEAWRTIRAAAFRLA